MPAGITQGLQEVTEVGATSDQDITLSGDNSYTGVNTFRHNTVDTAALVSDVTTSGLTSTAASFRVNNVNEAQYQRVLGFFPGFVGKTAGFLFFGINTNYLILDDTTGRNILANGTGLTIAGQIVLTRNAYATSATINQNDSISGFTGTSGGTLTIPAGKVFTGHTFIIQDEGGNAGTNPIVIAPASGTINGAASISIASNYGRYTIYSDGTNFFAS